MSWMWSGRRGAAEFHYPNRFPLLRAAPTLPKRRLPVDASGSTKEWPRPASRRQPRRRLASEIRLVGVELPFEEVPVAVPPLPPFVECVARPVPAADSHAAWVPALRTHQQQDAGQKTPCSTPCDSPLTPGPGLPLHGKCPAPPDSGHRAAPNELHLQKR